MTTGSNCFLVLRLHSAIALRTYSAWYVNFDYGIVDDNYGYRFNAFPVRLVRASQSLGIGLSSLTTDFADNTDGSVTHYCTGLIWQRCSVGQTWNGSTCSGPASTYTLDDDNTLTSTFAGHDDWRVPTVNELSSIISYDKGAPAINTTLFPNTPSDEFWSSSPYVGSADRAWYVSFSFGNVYGNGSRGLAFPVRLVRASQSLGIGKVTVMDTTTRSIKSFDHNTANSRFDAKFRADSDGYYNLTIVNTLPTTESSCIQAKNRWVSVQVSPNKPTLADADNYPTKEGFVNSDGLNIVFYGQKGKTYNLQAQFKLPSWYKVILTKQEVGPHLHLDEDSVNNADYGPRGVFNTNKKWPNSALTVAIDYAGVSLAKFKPVSGGDICLPTDNEIVCKGKVHQFIIDTASLWANGNSLSFAKSDDWNNADIKIAFCYGCGVNNSYVGTDSINKYPSMHLDVNNINKRTSLDTVLHEFGHAIGLSHEQQSPAFAFQWNTDEVDKLCASWGWTQAQCNNNFFTKPSPHYVFTDFDPLSIMEYPLPKKLVTDTTHCTSSESTMCVDASLKISATDIKLIRQMYPNQPKPFSYNIQCTTSGTSSLGESKSCDTGDQCTTAPKDYGFMSPTKNEVSMNGGSNGCSVQGYNAIFYNLGGNTTLYGKICYRAWATSSSGMTNSGSRGWANCDIVGTLQPIPENAKPLAIGQTYQGGIIFYLDSTKAHGLIAAPTDQSSNIHWGSTTKVTGATGTAIGTGQANTKAIITAQGAGSYAAKLCDDLVMGGYSDWFLPSKDELNELYKNRVVVGGFAATYYWSATEYDSSYAWNQSFGSGNQNANNLADSYRVRAVRAF